MKGKWLIARRIVQVCALVVFCLPLLAAGWSLAGAYLGGDLEVATPAQGVFFGSLSSSEVLGVNVLDPFAVLQIAVASKSFDLSWLLYALPVLLVYGLIRGRAFCGWVCPVNLLLELVDWLRRKAGIQVREACVPRRVKLGVAVAVLVLSALVGVPLFEALSPISAINKFLLFGSVAGVWVLLAIVLLDVLVSRRVWCRSLCPLGGFYEALGKVGLVNVSIKHDACISCGKCKEACLADPAILQPAIDGDDVIVRAGDCMICGACVDACPTKALGVCVGRPKKPVNAQDSANHSE